MRAAQTRFIVDEDEHLHLLHYAAEDEDLYLPYCAELRRDDLRLPGSMLSCQDLRICPLKQDVQSPGICLRNRPRTTCSRRVMVEETLHHQRWLRFLPRAPRRVN